jgi:hypothetical protein
MIPPDDTSHVVDIMARLKRGGPLRELRRDPDQEAAVPLETFVEGEVQKSIARLRRMIEEPPPPPPPDMPKPPTVPELRETGRMARDLAARLRAFALFDEHRAVIPALERISMDLLGDGQINPVTKMPQLGVLQFPPAHSVKPAYLAADEAFYLSRYAPKPPTIYALRKIASPLVAAAGSACSEATLKHACKYVWKDRKLRDPHAFKRP